MTELVIMAVALTLVSLAWLCINIKAGEQWVKFVSIVGLISTLVAASVILLLEFFRAVL